MEPLIKAAAFGVGVDHGCIWKVSIDGSRSNRAMNSVFVGYFLSLNAIHAWASERKHAGREPKKAHIAKKC
jgi:hypothetical protein